MNYKRIYETIARQHLRDERQMIFLSGPRQVGKTTICQNLATHYVNWDNDDDRLSVLSGQKAIAERCGLQISHDRRRIIAFDEIHRYRRWKLFLKGFFDVYGSKAKIVVTGSARMDVFKRGGDSLMGRYFPYRMHPFSVAELVDVSVPSTPIRSPRGIDEKDWQALLAYGGFPEPFTRRNASFLTRWRRLRMEQLVREDVRDLSRVAEMDQLAAMARILACRSGEQIVVDSLARDVKVAQNTASSWLATLSSLHFGFLVPPYHRNVADAIRKTPKWYLRDWSGISDPGKRNETLVACHLLKAVEGWTDLGLGEFGLFYVRDKKKREVDFLVARDGEPWFIVEVKTSDVRLADSLNWAQRATKAPHAFQVVMELPFQKKDPFAEKGPVCVSARTFLSQLM